MMLSRRVLVVNMVAVGLIGLGCGPYYKTMDPDVLVGKTADDLDSHVTMMLESGQELVGTLLRLEEGVLTIALDSSRELVQVPLHQISWIRYKSSQASEEATYRANVVLGAVGILGAMALILLLILLIAMATKGSCPFLYVTDPETGERKLWGECYSGAVVRALARADAMALPDLGIGRVRLWLSNEAPETQYTDAAWIEVVDHEPGARILATPDASLLQVGESSEPSRVTDLDGVDQTARLAEKGTGWASDLFEKASRRPRPSFEGLTAAFSKAPVQAVLELDLRTSPWLDRVSMLGWAALGQDRRERVQQNGRDAEGGGRAVDLVREAGIHAKVEVRQGGDWREVARIAPVGWVSRRQFVVPLGDVVAGEPVEVRLSGGIGFLVVHRMRLAPSLGPAEAVKVPVQQATQSTGSDELGRLASVDGVPNVLEQRSESVELVFDMPVPAEGTERTAFLRTHGYYEVHPPEDLEAPPVALRAMRDPSRFGAIGLELFERSVREIVVKR